MLGRQALFGLALVPQTGDLALLAAGFGIFRAAACRYRDEVTTASATSTSSSTTRERGGTTPARQVLEMSAVLHGS